MSPPAVITKVTGHISTAALAGDFRYLNELCSRGNWQFKPLTAEELNDLIGKNRKLFVADPGGPIIRIPAQKLSTLDHRGVMRARGTGTISEAYAAAARQMQSQGKQLYQRVVVGIKEVRDDHGYILAGPHGSVVPLSWTAQVKAQEMGLTASTPAAEAMSILSRMMREIIRCHSSSRRAVKTMTSSKKVGRDIVAHNLVVAPSQKILDSIRRAGQPVDRVLEAAARRVLEKMERRNGGRITAVASTHLEDSQGVRPHLHVRLSAHDSNGKYVALFDRKAGGSGGGRCTLQDDIEREITRIIERQEPRGRD